MYTTLTTRVRHLKTEIATTKTRADYCNVTRLQRLKWRTYTNFPLQFHHTVGTAMSLHTLITKVRQGRNYYRLKTHADYYNSTRLQWLKWTTRSDHYSFTDNTGATALNLHTLTTRVRQNRNYYNEDTDTVTATTILLTRLQRLKWRTYTNCQHTNCPLQFRHNTVCTALNLTLFTKVRQGRNYYNDWRHTLAITILQDCSDWMKNTMLPLQFHWQHRSDCRELAHTYY